MSFRSGSIIKLLLRDKVFFLYSPPNYFDLQIKITSLFIDLQLPFLITVKRNNILYSVTTDRDVEELGGKSGEDVIYLSIPFPISTIPTIPTIPPLSDYILCDDDVNVNELVQSTTNLVLLDDMNLGYKCLQALKQRGYFKIQLSEKELNIITCVFDEFKKFTEKDKLYKEQFYYTSLGSAQPQFGYRSTLLHKEYFVCRDVDNDVLKETLKYPTKEFEIIMSKARHMLNSISKVLLYNILLELDANMNEVNEIMKTLSQPAISFDTFGFTDMMEVFRYDCHLPFGEINTDNQYR